MFNSIIVSNTNNLTRLKTILEKAKAMQESLKISDEAMVGARLVLDQFPLAKQVQLVSDFAKRSGAVLCNIEAPKFEDNEKSLTELIERVDKTIAFLSTLSEDMVAADLETRLVPIAWMPGKGLTAKYYLEVYALSNFYFHFVTAYSILRHYGLQIGKMDYMEMPEFKDLA